MVLKRASGRSKRSLGQGDSQRALQSFTVPAPIGGVNIFDSLARMGPEDSVYSYNMVPSEYGLRTRRGFKEHVTGLANDVRTIIPFQGEAAADNKLFAVTQDGIYDCTSSADAPSAALSFGVTSGAAGYGNHYSYTNDNGDKFLFFADGANGLIEYNRGAGTWAVATDVTGISEANIRFVTEHKNRIWFALADSADAYYLALGAKGGAATKFSLGNKFPRGGSLHGIYTWSVDGGDGVDDLIVFVSTSGDVAVYQGTDVSSASTWQSIGTWYIGIPPVSRNIGENIGGELHFLTSFGLLSMQDLVSGVNVSKATGQNTIARKIARAVRNDMVDKTDDYQWDVIPVMSEGSVVIVRPYDTSATQIQYVFNFTTAGWGFWRDVPMNCGAEWTGNFYFGDDVGTVYIMRDSLDGVARDGTGGDPVPFSLLTAFTPLDSPGVDKRAHFVRPFFFSENGVEPAFNCQVQYNYNINEATQSIPAVSVDASAWDVGEWDSAIWGGLSVVSTRTISTCGMGQVLAVAVKGECTDRATLLDFSVYYDVGNRGIGLPL